MLSGIKKGKRKRQLDKSTDSAVKKPAAPSTSSSATAAFSSSSSSTAADNQNAAEELRRMLSVPSSIPANPSSSIFMDKVDDVIDRFEQRRGKLSEAFDGEASASASASDSVFIMKSSKAPIIQKEDFRNGARKGKVKEKEAFLHADEDKTIEELVAEEKQSQLEGSRGMDENFARNIARLGSRYKGAEFKSTAGATAGADEEDMAGDGGIDMKMFTSNESRLTEAAQYNREMSRQMDRAKKENKITSRCWWWMESSSFQKHRLLSLGDHVSLIYVPSHEALVGSQCYLVPVKHAESFASCEDEVWDEIARFRTSLRHVFAKEDKGVLFCETVLPTKGLWQARMDVIPVPKNVEQDAEM
jgi:hypothetical protein